MGILVTGATGNIGKELIRLVIASNTNAQVFAAVRDIDKARKSFALLAGLKFRAFDYEEPNSFNSALSGIDIVFLLRPPHILNIKKYYVPLLDSLKKQGIKKVVLLSVQGAESSAIIPHRKIELLVLQYQFDSIFVRPSYFMQNLTTTLLADIKAHNAIVLPSKNAKFNWVDIVNVAEACAVYLTAFDKYKNRAFDITGNENYDFSYVVSRINAITGATIEYRPVSPIRFILFELKNKMKISLILVMCLLHFLPRLQGEPKKSDVYVRLFGREPNTIDSFIRANKILLSQHQD
jgi:uncharacterized protein YbjT (DUF2867 family)